MAALSDHGVTGKVIRIAGVEVDVGDGDAWPKIRDTIVDCDILILSTPIWLGHPSSIAQRVLERLDAELGESDEEGRMLTYGKAAAVCVVGNEDGAHHVSAERPASPDRIGRRPRCPPTTSPASPIRCRSTPAPRSPSRQQAVTLAAALRYPTAIDAEILYLLGPGGSARLDWLTGADHGDDADDACHTWVDETVVSWAACLLAAPALAADAHHLADRGQAGELTRLTSPSSHEHDAAPLLRHPDLLEPIAALHRAPLLDLLDDQAAALG